MSRTLAAVAASLLLTAADTPSMTIAGARFAQSDVLDARGLPDLDGAAILVTLKPEAARRLALITRQLVGQTVEVDIGHAKLSAPIAREAIESGMLQITAPGLTLGRAEAMALTIAGKAPAPESIEE